MSYKPNYVLEINEAVLVSNGSKALSVLKIAVWVVVAVIVFGSLVFAENLFAEITWTTRILLIVIALGVLFVGRKKQNVESPMELQFFDHYLVVYRPKRYYSKKVTRMEINKMMYSDIFRCVYKSKSKRVHIYGNVSAKWFNYDAHGVIAQTPTYDRYVKDTLCYFSTRCAQDVDFVSVIENNSPIQVVVEDR